MKEEKSTLSSSSTRASGKVLLPWKWSPHGLTGKSRASDGRFGLFVLEDQKTHEQ